MSHTDQIHKEQESHGTQLFPFAIYYCDGNNGIRDEQFHWHENIEIFFIDKGNAKITISAKSYWVSEGDIVFVSPELLHCVEWKRGSELGYYKITFSGDILLNKSSDLCSLQCLLPLLKGQLYLPAYIGKDHKVNERISRCLNDLIYDYFNNKIPHEFYIKAQLFLLFHYIFSENLFVCDVNLILSNSSLQGIKALILYMEENYMEAINVEKAAAICGFSKSYFMKFFKSCMGISFIKYLNSYRLSKAAEMLSSSNSTVLEISEKVGFENHSYFIRAFKEKYEVTPLVFRKKYQIR